MFTLQDNDHTAVDHKCTNCWMGYPKPCECGGLVHAEFGDEDSDCNYWLCLACDTCGHDYKEKDR